MSSSATTPTAAGAAFARGPSPPRAVAQPPSPPQFSAGAASDVFGSTNSLPAAAGDGWNDADDDDGAAVQVVSPSCVCHPVFTIQYLPSCSAATDRTESCANACADVLHIG